MCGWNSHNNGQTKKNSNEKDTEINIIKEEKGVVSKENKWMKNRVTYVVVRAIVKCWEKKRGEREGRGL